MKKALSFRVLAIALCVAMLATVTPIFAAAESVTYLDYNATTGAVDLESEATDVNVIDEAMDSFVTGWNIVNGNVEFENRITLPANVNLILADGATLTAKKGITVAEDGDFAVYAQSSDADTMGQLIVPEREENYDAGIGCLEEGSCGNITVYGGMLTVQGGYYSAGIGCANHGACGNITIYDGVVTAEGANHGVGIGAGSYGSCGEVTIAGGTVTAESASHGAGIGSGSYGSCGEVTIAGGIVTANSGKLGAGIGSGFGGSCTKVTVSGGYVKATAAEGADSIGAGYSCEVAVPVSIDDSCASLTKDGSQYINYEPFAAVKTTCTAVGALAYVKDYVSGNYYTAFPFTEDGLIGDATALAAWKAEGGDGYVEKLPHADNNEDDRCDGCGAVHATYLDYNETTGKVDLEREVWGVHVVNADNTWFDFGWNVVEGDVTIEERIILPGNVNLILANGATLTAEKGIAVPRDGDFAIYAQSNDAATMGKLIVQGADEHDAGIGSSGLENCGNIAIYGGIVTAIGDYSGAGIGSGCMNSSCGNITIRGGMVTAQGGYGSAGIGSGYNSSSCGNITISGGYVKATAGYSANPIGAGHKSSCGTVSIAGSCTSVTDGSTRYINYLTPALDPTCTESGFAEHYIDPVSNTYYTALSFEQDKLIGDAAALAAWKAEGGGYVPPLGHDWQFVDETIHQCARCETTAAHTGVDDFVCDDCGGILLETAQTVAEAKGAAKAALDAAADPIGSDAQAQVLSDAKAAVDAATTLDDVATAKADGLSAIAAQKATELAAKIAELKADINDNLFPAAKCYEAKDILYAALSDLDAAASVSEANEIYNTAKAQANDKDAVFADKLSNYKATFPLAITDAVSEETEQFVENVQTALDNALSIAVLDEIYEENRPYISFHATKDTMLSQCKEILESGENTEAMDAVFEMTFEMLSKTTNMDELEDVYAYCSEQIEVQRERESYLPECEMILASDEYSDEVKALVREFIEALNAAESLKDIEYTFYDYAPAINLQAVRDQWMAELEELLPEEPSDAVNAIIEDASELILYGEDSSIFDNVYDIARRSVERQLTAEANTKALENLFKQTEEALASANDTIDTLNGTMDELNDTVKSKEATIAEKQAALDTATEQLNAAKADLENTKADLENTKAELENTKAELETAKADVEELQEALEMAQIALDDAQTGFNKLEATLAQQEVQLSQAQQTVNDLQAEVERLKALLDDDPTDPPPAETIGDANGDGAVNMKDVLLLRKYLADTADTMNMANADVNGDGDVNMKDVLLLRKYLAGVVENLGA